MATAVQQRRGTATEHDDGAGFTGLEGEITVDTTNDTIRVHDNSTKGGHRLAKYSELPNTATQITTADESSDAECFPVFTTEATGNLAPKTDTAFKYNASNGTLTTGGMTVNGAGTFNVGTNTFNINSTGIDTALRVSTNSTTNDNAPDILIQRTALPNTSGDTFHRCGDIKFQSRNDNSEDHLYGKIRCRAGDHRDGQEQGRLDFFVASGTGGVFGAAGAYIEHSFTKDGLIVTGTVTAEQIHIDAQVLDTNDAGSEVTATEMAGYAGQTITFTASTGTTARTVTLPDAVTADVGKRWVLCNAATANITIALNSQKLNILSGAAVVNCGSDNPHIVAGGVAEIICVAGETGTDAQPNYIIFGSGVVDN